MTAPRILLTGANGQVGFELRRALAPLGEVLAVTRHEADLQQPSSILPLLDAFCPRLIVNAAAWTAVDLAEQQPDAAWQVNAVLPGLLAQWAADRQARLVHYSTDYVFDGLASRPYDETDPAYPLSVYGQSKWAGEEAVRAAGGAPVIVRTSWVFGAHGRNFLKTVLRLAAEREQLAIVADQTGAPTPASLIADVTAHLVRHWPDEGATYHLAGQGETSWHGYACEVVRVARALGWSLRATETAIRPIATSDYPLPAVRPANSRLDCRKIQADLQLWLPDWQSGVRQVLASLQSS
ncbi:MAG: dTDP-4-dehydrorhamnose reductase [Laribacter sp.]|nr:dTDP-4-dehydrorhamnose reductase [Laribacter sp.]